MLKAIIIVLILFYIFARFAGFFFRIIFWLLGNKLQRHRGVQSSSSGEKVYDFGDMKVIVPRKRRKEDSQKFDDYQEVTEV